MSQYRQPKKIQQPERILVLCEGESEIIYLKGYRSEDSNRRRLSRLEIEIYQPTNFSPLGLLKEAKRKIREAQKDKMPYKSVWIVFDKDRHVSIPQTMEEAGSFIPPINIAFSVNCFEYWILLHFERSRRLYNNCSQIQSAIEAKYFPNYAKTMNFFPLLQPHLQTALANAEWLHQQNRFELERGAAITDLQSYTSFDLLIRYLEAITL